MDHKTCGSVVVVPAAETTDVDAQSQSPEEDPAHHLLHNASRVVLPCSRVAALALVSYIFAATAWRGRREPGDLAFISGAYAAMAGLLLCLRRAERLTPDAPAAAMARRRLHVAVWALSTALSCAFAYRVSLLVPAALVVVICCMTSFVVLVGFYMIVLCEDQQYQCVDDVDCDTAGDRKPLLIKKISRPSDEMV